MERKKLAGTDLAVSPIALGTDVYGLVLSEEEAYGMIDAYMHLGGNVIDTALVYSDWEPGEKARSEKLIGRYLKKSGNRAELVISTKGGHPVPGHMEVSRLSEKEIRSDMEKSLINLGVDYVDIYWLHRDAADADIAEICHTLDALVKEGKTRYIGMSNWTAKRIGEYNAYAKEHGLARVFSSQIQYSIAKSIPENNDPTLVLMNDEEYAFFKQNKMPVFAFASQAKGFFQKLERGGIDALSEKASTRYLSEENLQRFERVKKIASEHGISCGEAALAALISNTDFETVAIVGCKNTAQLTESLSAAEANISQAEIDYIVKG